MFKSKNCLWVVVGISFFVTAKPLKAESKKAPQWLAASSPSNSPRNSSLSSSAVLKKKETPSSPTFTGMFDSRAGYFSKSGKADTENAIELGANLTPTIKLSYVQLFNTAIHDSPDTTNGQSVLLDAGYIRSKYKNIWQSEDKQTALSIEQRLYLLNAYFQQDINMITVFRNYFKLSQKVSDSVTFTLMEVPILFVNGSSGVRESANPAFENRVILVSDITITKDLSFSFPIYFHQTRFLNYKEGARNNDKWGYVLWVNPELDYKINENVMIGVAYSNWSNLIAPDLSKTNFADGFEDGIYQAIVTFTF